MDNLTHSLTGLALARAGLNRLTPRATLLLVLSANVPDIDILALVAGWRSRIGPRMTYFEAHRGYTHSLVCLPLMALFTVFFVAVVCRQRVSWLRAWMVCCVGVASHLLLDWTNSYGIRLGLPFDSRWFHGDLNGLYDLVIWAVLLLAAIWPWFARLVGSEIGAKPGDGRASAWAALAFFVLFDATRGVLHARAVAALNSRYYGDAVPLSVGAFPDAANPLRWRGVVETPARYYVLIVDAGAAQFNLDSADVYYKPPLNAITRVAKKTEEFRFLEYFARYPLWTLSSTDIECRLAARVELSDLRFGGPGAGPFYTVAYVNDRGEIVPPQIAQRPCGG